MLLVYSFEKSAHVLKYINAIEDVGLNKIVPLRITVHSFSIEQYYDVLVRQQGYLRQYLNSIFYTVSIVVVQIFLGSLVAFSISCFDVPWKNAIYFMYAILTVFPAE